MTPEGTMEKGELLAWMTAQGHKPRKDIVRLDALMAEMTRDELKQIYDWMTLEQFKDLCDPDTDPEHRREVLRQLDVCPCCQQWLGHNNPPADSDDPPTPYRRQSSFDF